MDPRVIYITCSSQDEAQTIAKALLTQRLIACANIFPGIQSMYWWNDEIQNETEVAMIAKTTDDLVPQVIAATKSLHSYDCPCIVSLPITDGNPEFLKWINTETHTITNPR
ncbi:divalent-cation tolerance protein CutA [bacterium M21]|nr:divalent-cation tolerance protein CutA [bacterium M21]